MTVQTGDVVVVDFTTHDPETMAAADADSLPTGTLVLNGTDNGATVTVTNKATGNYKASVTLPTLAAGDQVQLRVSATVGGVADKSIVWGGIADTKRVSGLNDPSAGTIADSVWDEQMSGHTSEGSAGYALSQLATDVWKVMTSGLSTVGSIGKLLVDRIDAAITSRAAPGAQMDLIDAPNSTALTAIGARLEEMILDEGDATPLLAAIAAKVEEFVANDGDETAVLAAIAAAVRTNLATELARIDATISSRLASAGYTAPLDAAGLRTAIGLADADLDDQLGGLSSRLPDALTEQGLMKSDALRVVGDADAAANLVLVFSTDFSANYDATNDRWIVESRKYYDRGLSEWKDYPENLYALGINSDGHVARVTLADTTTTNTDMRGTDNAATASALATAQTSLDTLSSRLTSTRAGYLDNLGVGGPVASQADVTAINQSASRRLTLATVQQWERPEDPEVNNDYWIELRVYDEDGALVNADEAPALTLTGLLNGDVSNRIWNSDNPSTGIYRYMVAVQSNYDLEQIRIDAAVEIDSDPFTISAFAQVCDFVAQTFTTSDRALLESIQSGVEDVPTNAELSAALSAADDAVLAAIAALNNLSSAGAQAAASAALAAYGAATGAQVGTAATSAAAAATASAAVKVVTDKQATMLEADDANWRFTVDALANVPVGENAVDWNDEQKAFILQSLIDIETKTNTLGTAEVSVVSPVAVDGDFSLNQGDVYAAAIGRALAWTNAAGTWPNLTGATVSLRISQLGISATFPATVVVPSGAGQQVRVELTGAETGELSAGRWRFSIVAELADDAGRVTLVGPGTLTVIEQVDED